MAKQSFFTSTIGRKYAMALSALFLLVFLLQHFFINFTSVLSKETFNSLSHFMGNNILVQFIMQPILIIGVIFHFVMGFILEIKNNSARQSKYVMFKGNANSTWMSRNMIWTGLVVLAFLALHFYDFWFPEMDYKYIAQNAPDANRYYEELVHKFEDPFRVGFYVLAFAFLALHLLHGFQSSFQSLGANHERWTPVIKGLGTAYAIVIPLGFIFIALFHHFSH
mgnify:CR=1 FL=1